MRVLLTGATGFVGSHLARRLVAGGETVHALIRPGADRRRLTGVISDLRVVEADLADEARIAQQVRAIRPELCVHLAWYAEPGKYLASPENLTALRGSMCLLACLADAGCHRAVIAGTCFEYDTAHGYLRESTPTEPHTLYAGCKLALYQVARQLTLAGTLDVAWARLFYLYGPQEDARRLVPSVILGLLAGRRVEVTPGEQVRDYLHVADVAAALEAIARSDLAGPVNVGSGRPVSIRDVVLTAGRLLDRSELIALGARPYSPGDPMFICADASRLRQGTAWQPRFDLETGLQDTIDWWRSDAHV